MKLNILQMLFVIVIFVLGSFMAFVIIPSMAETDGKDLNEITSITKAKNQYLVTDLRAMSNKDLAEMYFEKGWDKSGMFYVLMAILDESEKQTTILQEIRKDLKNRPRIVIREYSGLDPGFWQPHRPWDPEQYDPWHEWRDGGEILLLPNWRYRFDEDGNVVMED